ncbi:Na+/H+ antiporter subunit E [Specibacter sp. NPDC057265]|uniref:Na+/H+ antiporter subunit E n=1 Tax=Specibacter sp. NPDC057265 TaxID=3346075 RepID=UPI00362E11FC
MSKMTRVGQKSAFVQKLPLFIWLVVVWGALWRDFSVGNLVFGAIIAVAISQVFYLPPVELSGRFNVLRAVLFLPWFLRKVTVASFEVLYWAVVKGPNIRNAVIAVPLRSPSDLLMTSVGHVLSLIPGSLVVEVDRGSSTLYVHAMNVPTPDAAEKVRHDIQYIEARLIEVMGTKAELAAVRAERSGAAMVSYVQSRQAQPGGACATTQEVQ